MGWLFQKCRVCRDPGSRVPCLSRTLRTGFSPWCLFPAQAESEMTGVLLLLLLDLILQLERMYWVGRVVCDGNGACFCCAFVSGAVWAQLCRPSCLCCLALPLWPLVPLRCSCGCRKEGFARQGLGKGFVCGLPLATARGSGQPCCPRVPMSAVVQMPARCWAARRYFGSSVCPVPASSVLTSLPGVWFCPERARWCECREEGREQQEPLLSPAPPRVLPLRECFLHWRSPREECAVAARGRHTWLGSACVLIWP